MQTNASVWIRTRESIFQVSLYRASHLRQLTAYLMVTTCHQVYFEQAIVLRMSNQLIMQGCFLCSMLFLIIGIRLILLLIFYQIMSQISLNFFRCILDDGPISLFHLTVSEHIIQPRQCFTRLGKDDKSTHRTVQAVHNAEEDIPRFRIRLLDILLYGFRQRCISCLITLNNFRSRFVNNDDVVIFVYDSHDPYIFIPPSTWMTCPVTYEDKSEARNVATFAISSTVPPRRNGILLIHSLRISSGRA